MKKILYTIIFALGIFVATTQYAGATVYQAGPTGEIWVTVNIQNMNNPGSPNYNPGDQIIADISMQNASSTAQTVNMSAVTIGNASVNFFPPPVFSNPVVLAPGEQKVGQTQYFTVSVPGPGTYTVDFTADVLVPDIIFRNTSIDIAIDSIFLDTIDARPFVAAGQPDRVFTLATPSLISIPFSWNASATSAQHIEVTDTNGAKQCVDVSNGEPNPNRTFTNVAMNGPSSLIVEAGNNPCNLLPELTGIQAYPGVQVGGTGNDALFCSGVMAAPSPSNAGASLQITYSLGGSGSYVSSCGFVIGVGNTTGEGYILANDAQVLDVCVESAAMPVNPSLPRC